MNKLEINNSIHLELKPYKKGKWKVILFKDDKQYGTADVISSEDPWVTFKGRNKAILENLVELLGGDLSANNRIKIQNWFAKGASVDYNALSEVDERLELNRYGFKEINGEFYLTESAWASTYNEDGTRELNEITFLRTKDTFGAIKPNDRRYFFDDKKVGVGIRDWTVKIETIAKVKKQFEEVDRMDRTFREKKKNLLNKLRERSKKHVFHADPRNETTHMLWTLGTYFYDVFDFFPILSVLGPSDSGKTVLCSLLKATCYHGSGFINPTEASIFRLKEAGRITLIIDENDELNSADKNFKTTIRQLLRASVSKYGGSVPRTESINNRRYVVEYSIYSPSVSSGIEGLEGVLESRSIPLTMTRAIGDKEYVSANPHDYIDLVKELYSIRFLLVEQVMEIRDNFIENGIHKEIKGRQFDVWLPIFTMAKIFCDDDEYNRLKQHAVMIARSYKNAPRNIYETEVVLTSLNELYVNDRYYSIDEITASINMTYEWTSSDKWNAIKTGRILTRLGFNNKGRMRTTGVIKRRITTYMIAKEFLDMKILHYMGEF